MKRLIPLIMSALLFCGCVPHTELDKLAIAEAIGGKLENAAKYDLNKEATNVCIDSRLIEEGGVFIATKGERVDGHTFIPQVFEKGAIAVICEKMPRGLAWMPTAFAVRRMLHA